MSLMSCFLVMISGALGTLARYGVSVLAAPSVASCRSPLLLAILLGHSSLAYLRR